MLFRAESDPRVIKNVRQEDDATVVQVTGRLDASVAQEMKAELQELIEDGNTQLVLNLADVNFIDSAGLGVFVSCLRRAATKGGDLRLAEVPEFARSIFELTRLTRVFNIRESEEDALEALKKGEEA